MLVHVKKIITNSLTRKKKVYIIRSVAIPRVASGVLLEACSSIGLARLLAKENVEY